MNFIWMTLISIVIFVLIDAIWLGLIAPKFYRKYLSHLLSDTPNFKAAILFYLVYIIGVGYLVVWPAITDQLVGQAFLSGAVFGFVAYATYDLTNLATLKAWPIQVTVVDLIWGTALTSLVSGLTFIVYHLIF